MSYVTHKLNMHIYGHMDMRLIITLCDVLYNIVIFVYKN